MPKFQEEPMKKLSSMFKKSAQKKKSKKSGRKVLPFPKSIRQLELLPAVGIKLALRVIAYLMPGLRMRTVGRIAAKRPRDCGAFSLEKRRVSPTPDFRFYVVIVN
jgi:hypothetical protein